MKATLNPRIAILGMALEANRQAPVTDEEAFVETLYANASAIEQELKGDRAGLPATARGFANAMDEKGDWTPVPILLAEAPPGGPIDHAFYEKMLNTMRTDLKNAGPLDGVYISEHGAGLTTKTDDPDGLIFAMVREVVGPDIPIVATLDLHGHVTPMMHDSADVLIAYVTNPHVDQEERGAEAAQILKQIVHDGVKTCSAFVQVPMISPAVSLLTDHGPYADLIRFGQSQLTEPILNVSILAGFAPADATTNGMSVVVTADSSFVGSSDKVREAAAEIAQRAWGDRHRYVAELTSLDEAVEKAAQVASNKNKSPIILADVADNPGAGGRGNTTFILRGLHEASVKGVVVGMMIDPVLAAEAYERGTGSRFSALFNRDEKTRFSDTYEAEVDIERLVDEPCVGRRGLFAGRRIDLGRCALLNMDGIRIAVASKRHQCADPIFLERLGLDLAEIRVLVIKSRGHFRAGFDEYFPAEQIIEVDAPGLTTPILDRLELTRVSRPVYPLDPEMSWQAPIT